MGALSIGGSIVSVSFPVSYLINNNKIIIIIIIII